ncbi:MAG: histidine kinase, partial [Comamonadaceae bacterium]
MTLSILGSLTLGYRPLWNRARALAGVQVFVHQDAPTTDGLHLLRTIDEIWTAASPPLLLSVRTPELLADLLGQAAAGAPMIDVP